MYAKIAVRCRADIKQFAGYCSHALSREVFWHEYAKIPRHTARIYAISINSVHHGALYCERSEQYRDSQLIKVRDSWCQQQRDAHFVYKYRSET